MLVGADQRQTLRAPRVSCFISLPSGGSAPWNCQEAAPRLPLAADTTGMRFPCVSDVSPFSCTTELQSYGVLPNVEAPLQAPRAVLLLELVPTEGMCPRRAVFMLRPKRKQFYSLSSS